VLLGVGLAYLVLFPSSLLVWRVRRRRRARQPLERMELAWVEAVEAARLVGFAERPSDTYAERAAHLAEAVPDAAPAAFALAECLDAASYSLEGATAEQVDRAEAATAQVRAAVVAATSRWARIRPGIDPRAMVGGWRLRRRTRQRRISLSARGDLEQERELVGSRDDG
jgi:hypothetical protein